MKKNILITDKIEEICINILKEKGFSVTYFPNLPLDELNNMLTNYHGLIVRSRTLVNKEIIEYGAANKLEVIGRAGMGLDNINLQAAKKHGIKVFNVTDGHIYSVAEHTIGLMLALNRKLIDANNSTKSGKWEKAKFKGNELYGKYLGIIGCGQIGHAVKKIAAAMGMEILIYDPYKKSALYAANENVEFGSLKALFKRCDIITLHVPLNSKTENMITSELLASSKKGLKIINTSRGKVINESALIEALLYGFISGAALDVFSEEPPYGSSILNFDNVIVTPHIASSTLEAQERISKKIANSVANYLMNK